MLLGEFFMPIARLSSKSQIVIPAEIRNPLELIVLIPICNQDDLYVCYYPFGNALLICGDLRYQFIPLNT